MNKNISRLLPIAFLAALVTWYGCKKETPLTIPAEQAHFTFQTGGNYFITAPGVTYKVPIGLTAVSGTDRTVSVTITSPTGAVQGTHYTVNKTTFTIPAGKATDTIVVTGNFPQYTAGRKDTLVFTINGTDKGSSVAAFETNNTYKLYMRGPCSELEINDAGALQEFVGAYTANEIAFGSPYGPYNTTISSVTQTSPTTATAVITNVFDAGWSPMTVTLDWTDMANRKVTFVAQSVGGNAGASFGAAYNGMPYAIRPASSGQIGTFSFCSKTLSLYGNIGIWGVGYNGQLYTLNMTKK